MKKRFFLLAIPFLCSSAYAGYAQLAVPAFSNTATGYAYKSAANDVWSAVKTVRTSATLNVAGKAVTMPVQMRLAANAPRVAAAFGFTPAGIALITAAGVGSALYNYYLSGGFELDGNVWKKRPLDGFDTFYSTGELPGQLFISPASGGAAVAASYNSQISGYSFSIQSCDSSSCVLKRIQQNNGAEGFSIITFEPVQVPRVGQPLPVTQPEFEDGAQPIPDGVPQALPIPLPVEQPIINPSDDPEPLPQPLRVPTGEPVPVPDSSPPAWRSPVTDVVPAPTAQSPLQVELQPKEITTTGTKPSTEIVPVPVTPPVDEVATPKENPGLCDLFPSILACADIGEPPAPDPLKTRNFDVSIVSQAFSMGGGCPAPLPFTVLGHQYAISYNPICDQMLVLRFIFIALGGFIAAFILADSFRV
jgi:hypothetical protein